MNRQLNAIGNVPITTSIIESLYPELKSADKKVTWLEKQGEPLWKGSPKSICV
ncbi:MAG: hypothetical protein IJA00_02850 [Bacteroidaceae bacterium]|nr:hypothetical protein [Bacteroidaceae bacterium]